MLMPHFYKEYKQLCSQYDTEEACERAIYRMKWPNGYVCPICGCRYAYTIRSRSRKWYECRKCGHQSSVTSGTIMEGSRTPLRKWVHAIILHSLPEGYSAKEVARILQVTYKTAWLICHKIRHAMGHSLGREWLSGIVRIQPARYRRTIMPTARYLTEWTKTILGAGQFSPSGKLTNLRIMKVDDEQVCRRVVQPAAIQTLLQKYLDPRAPEPKIVAQDYGPERDGKLNYEILDSKNWINDAFQGGIGDKHLQAYLNQRCFVFDASNPVDAFGKLLQISLETPRITWAQLTRGMGELLLEKEAARFSRFRRWNAV
jgi:transposase-like protein